MRSSFIWISRLEGLSYLVLLLIAMPLKYWEDMPMAVKYVGWAHGVLFMLYIGLLIGMAVDEKWNLKKIFLGFIASLLPFGPFVFEKKIL